MPVTRAVRRFIPAFCILIAVPAYVAGQAAPPPNLTSDEMEKFLVEARIVRSRSAGDGVTGSSRVTLSDGTLTHDAHVQTIDRSEAVYKVPGYMEANFRDCYCYNIAAYRLARLLGLDNVPMSVPRRVDGRRASMTWWTDNVMMDEKVRLTKQLSDPDPRRGDHYIFRLRVFDELIQNRDRNSGNVLYTTDWKLWMIDHTRAFRLPRDLLKPQGLVRIDRALFEALQKLSAAEVTTAMDGHLNKGEIDGLMARRDAIVQLFTDRIAERGEALVLYSYPPQ